MDDPSWLSVSNGQNRLENIGRCSLSGVGRGVRAQAMAGGQWAPSGCGRGYIVYGQKGPVISSGIGLGRGRLRSEEPVAPGRQNGEASIVDAEANRQSRQRHRNTRVDFAVQSPPTTENGRASSPTPDVAPKTQHQLPSNGTGRRSGKAPIPPSCAPPLFGSVRSAKTAPCRSPERLRRLAEERQRYLKELDSQKASDDSRLLQLQRACRFLDANSLAPGVETIPDAEVIEVPRAPRLTGFASIHGTRYEDSKTGAKYPVYAVKEMQSDRLILRSIGLPHQEIVVPFKGGTFNKISMTEFDIFEVVHPGDHVLVEKTCSFYDNKTGGATIRAVAISFPDNVFKAQNFDVPESIDAAARWITHGSIKIMDDGTVLIATETLLGDDDKGKTILIKAPPSAFAYDDPTVDVESTVITRAKLVGCLQDAFSDAAATPNSPWEADSVAVATAGVRTGLGALAFGFKKRIALICAPEFGWVYIPSTLLLKNPDLEKAKRGTMLAFDATLNRASDKKEKEETKLAGIYKWRAVYVKIAEIQQWPEWGQLTAHTSARMRVDGTGDTRPRSNSSACPISNSGCRRPVGRSCGRGLLVQPRPPMVIPGGDHSSVSSGIGSSTGVGGSVLSDGVDQFRDASEITLVNRGSSYLIKSENIPGMEAVPMAPCLRCENELVCLCP